MTWRDDDLHGAAFGRPFSFYLSRNLARPLGFLLHDVRRHPMADRDRPSLDSFNPNVDDNGQLMGQESPLDIGTPPALQKHLNENPSGQAETARLASDRQRLDSVEGGSIETSEATAAETPAENIRRISDPSLSRTRKP
jgi:hypothetical protein